ncbi:MAG: hypothetical protein KF781_03730 [Chitinophagaceae bacterium]|nr:hypothetical protein [Chitinophagaceae bacterium]MCW5904806.1 hypothetical protein [Chitinophagaceae bacterium]
MRFIKLAVISCVILSIAITVIGLLLPSSVVVSRAINITANQDVVFKKMSNMYEWKNWITGLDKEGVIIQSATEGNFLGTKVTITDTTNYTIHSSWVGKSGSVQHSIMRIIHHASSAQIVVQWQFTEYLKWYPWQRFGSMMNEAVTGAQLEKNLSALKQLVEHR